jgi:hypothetical protein
LFKSISDQLQPDAVDAQPSFRERHLVLMMPLMQLTDVNRQTLSELKAPSDWGDARVDAVLFWEDDDDDKRKAQRAVVGIARFRQWSHFCGEHHGNAYAIPFATKDIDPAANGEFVGGVYDSVLRMLQDVAKR